MVGVSDLGTLLPRASGYSPYHVLRKIFGAPTWRMRFMALQRPFVSYSQWVRTRMGTVQPHSEFLPCAKLSRKLPTTRDSNLAEYEGVITQHCSSFQACTRCEYGWENGQFCYRPNPVLDTRQVPVENKGDNEQYKDLVLRTHPLANRKWPTWMIPVRSKLWGGL